MVFVAAAGAVSRYSMTVGSPLPGAGWMTMKPPPPTLPAAGQVTAIAKAVATAASTALPPFCSTETPTSAAIASMATTMPCRARTGWRACRGTASTNAIASGNSLFIAWAPGWVTDRRAG